MDLADDLTGVENVLDDGLDQDGVDALLGEGDLVRVGDELRERAAVDVEPDDPCPAIGVDASTPLPSVPPPTTRARGEAPEAGDSSSSTFRSAALLGGFHSDRNHVGSRSIDHRWVPGSGTEPERCADRSSPSSTMLRSKSTSAGHRPTTGNLPDAPKAHDSDPHRKPPPVWTRPHPQRGPISSDATLARSTSPNLGYPHPLKVARTG